MSRSLHPRPCKLYSRQLALSVWAMSKIKPIPLDLSVHRVNLGKIPRSAEVGQVTLTVPLLEASRTHLEAPRCRVPIYNQRVNTFLELRFLPLRPKNRCVIAHRPRQSCHNLDKLTPGCPLLDITSLIRWSMAVARRLGTCPPNTLSR